MSLLIDNLDKPANCCECLASGLAKISGCNKWFNSDGHFNMEDCPISCVPDHHGKLIDADAATARLKYLYCDGCGCTCGTCPWNAFIKYIDGRPTIIDAKGNDTQ